MTVWPKDRILKVLGRCLVIPIDIMAIDVETGPIPSAYPGFHPGKWDWYGKRQSQWFGPNGAAVRLTVDLYAEWD